MFLQGEAGGEYGGWGDVLMIRCDPMFLQGEAGDKIWRLKWYSNDPMFLQGEAGGEYGGWSEIPARGPGQDWHWQQELHSKVHVLNSIS